LSKSKDDQHQDKTPQCRDDHTPPASTSVWQISEKPNFREANRGPWLSRPPVKQSGGKNQQHQYEWVGKFRHEAGLGSGNISGGWSFVHIFRSRLGHIPPIQKAPRETPTGLNDLAYKIDP
jgi:hypothetical protein